MNLVRVTLHTVEERTRHACLRCCLGRYTDCISILPGKAASQPLIFLLLRSGQTKPSKESSCFHLSLSTLSLCLSHGPCTGPWRVPLLRQGCLLTARGVEFCSVCRVLSLIACKLGNYYWCPQLFTNVKQLWFVLSYFFKAHLLCKCSSKSAQGDSQVADANTRACRWLIRRWQQRHVWLVSTEGPWTF